MTDRRVEGMEANRRLRVEKEREGEVGDGKKRDEKERRGKRRE